MNYLLKVLQMANFSRIIHSPTLGELSLGEVSDLYLIIHLLKMSKCELSLKVLQIANFSIIIISSTFGEELSRSLRPVANYICYV